MTKAAALLQTLFAGTWSAFAVYIAHTHFNTARGWTFCGLTLLTVWLFFAHCWHRPPATESPLFYAEQEPSEGVWPPPPVVPTYKDDKSD